MGAYTNYAGKRIIVLETLASGSMLIEAAAAAGINYRTIIDWKKKDPEFKQKCDDAVRAGTAAMVAEARRRAVYGVAEPLVKGGAIVRDVNPDTGELERVMVRKYSDSLLMFVLKSRDPEAYCDTVRAERIKRKWTKKDAAADAAKGPLDYTIDAADADLA